VNMEGNRLHCMRRHMLRETAGSGIIIVAKEIAPKLHLIAKKG